MSGADVIVVGAGPAGSTTAILLARAGARVILVDRERFPRDKLCGEFVSPEALRILDRAGVLASLAPSSGRAREALITDSAGHSVRLPIPSLPGAPTEALGIPRYDMDLALIEEAARLGVEVVQGFEVSRLVRSEQNAPGIAGSHRGRARSDVETVFGARFVVAADGRDSTVARLADPLRARGRASRRFGLKAHFRLAEWPGGAVELHYFRGGYVGMHDVGGGSINVCALIDRDVAGPIPKDPDEIVQTTFFSNPLARRRLEGATRLTNWHAVGSLFFGVETPVLAGMIFAGDAAGTIDPFAGEGMSMALRSAEIAAEEILVALGSDGTPSSRDNSGPSPRERNSVGSGTRGLLGLSPDESALARYEARWRAEFSRRIALCRRLGRLSVRPALHSPMLALVRAFPLLGRLVARATRSGVPRSG